MVYLWLLWPVKKNGFVTALVIINKFYQIFRINTLLQKEEQMLHAKIRIYFGHPNTRVSLNKARRPITKTAGELTKIIRHPSQIAKV